MLDFKSQCFARREEREKSKALMNLSRKVFCHLYNSVLKLFTAERTSGEELCVVVSCFLNMRSSRNYKLQK